MLIMIAVILVLNIAAAKFNFVFNAFSLAFVDGFSAVDIKMHDGLLSKHVVEIYPIN